MYIVIFPSIDSEKYIILVFQVDGFGRRILQENTGNHWNMEAVFGHVGYFRIRFEFFYLGFVPRLVPTLISLVPSRSR
jgi:hypothetical protein